MHRDEWIRCPECKRPQLAQVVLTDGPWDFYVHECQCGYIITESDWDKIPPPKEGANHE